jgi:hypothetical protein
MKKSTTLFLTLAAVLSTACATRPSSVQASQVSATRYAKFDCEDLNERHEGLLAKENQLATEMTNTANTQVLGGVLLATTGIGYTRTVNNSSYGTALADVRGHLVAVKEQAKNINCTLKTTTPADTDTPVTTPTK